MSRFYNSTSNSRSGITTASGIPSGQMTHERGWNAGVRIVAQPDSADRDTFTVIMTSGSHAAGHDVVLGQVTDTPDGPRWEPAPAS